MLMPGSRTWTLAARSAALRKDCALNIKGGPFFFLDINIEPNYALNINIGTHHSLDINIGPSYRTTYDALDAPLCCSGFRSRVYLDSAFDGRLSPVPRKRRGLFLMSEAPLGSYGGPRGRGCH